VTGPGGDPDKDKIVRLGGAGENKGKGSQGTLYSFTEKKGKTGGGMKGACGETKPRTHGRPCRKPGKSDIGRERTTAGHTSPARERRTRNAKKACRLKAKVQRMTGTKKKSALGETRREKEKGKSQMRP